LASLAQAVGLSRMHFAAQFRAAMGVPPHEFVLRRRIECTQRLLLETDSTLVDIALSVGFQTQAHFTTVFKRFVGDTPHRWRSATLAKTQSMVASANDRDSLIPSSMQLLERHEYQGRTR
jgi:AraC family transcriptional regulator